MHARQKTFSPRRRTALFEQLPVIKLQQSFENQRALRPCQTQCLAITGMGDVQLATQQSLLGQP